jgi:hypothetical protein
MRRLSALPPHGTIARYVGRDRCRCIDCRCAATEYFANLRENENHGPILTLNVPAIRAILHNKKMDDADIAAVLGVTLRVVRTWFRTGRLTLYKVDELAVALGTHYSLIVRDDVVSVA